MQTIRNDREYCRFLNWSGQSWRVLSPLLAAVVVKHANLHTIDALPYHVLDQGHGGVLLILASHLVSILNIYIFMYTYT